MARGTTDSQGHEALSKLRKRHEELVAHARTPIELPEVDLVLDLESRDSERRKGRHLAQMCMLHHAHLTTATQYKLPCLTEMYLLAADAGNPFGLYSSARAIVEFSAFLYEVRRRLQAISSSGDDWVSRGERYFETIVRARFGTGDSDLQQRIAAESLPHDELVLPKPFHVNDGLRSLSKHAEYESVLEQYERLCDFVHHNLSSQRATAEGYRIARSAEHQSGGGFVAPTSGPILRYQYPVLQPAEQAIEWTAPLAFRHVLAIVEWHNTIPSSPFSSEELIQLTGSPIGFEVRFPGSRSPVTVQKTPRNAQCPCGSGKKYKYCHGKPQNL